MKLSSLFSLSLLALQGCAHPLTPSLDHSPSVHVSADAALSCNTLGRDLVARIVGSEVVLIEPSSSGSGLCHFKMADGEWFDLNLIRWPDVKMYTSATCEDKQNGPTWGMVHHPFCSALAGPHEARVQSAQYSGMSKDKMKRLLDEAVASLAHSAGAKVVNLK